MRYARTIAKRNGTRRLEVCKNNSKGEKTISGRHIEKKRRGNPSRCFRERISPQADFPTTNYKGRRDESYYRSVKKKALYCNTCRPMNRPIVPGGKISPKSELKDKKRLSEILRAAMKRRTQNRYGEIVIPTPLPNHIANFFQPFLNYSSSFEPLAYHFWLIQGILRPAPDAGS